LPSVPEHLRELAGFRSLLFSWTRREIKVRYANTALGVAWLLVYPLAWVALFTLLFTYALKFPAPDAPYPAFVMAGLAPWFFFSNTVSNAASSLRNNAFLIPKVYFPREILPLGSLLTGLLDLAVYLLLLLLLILIHRLPLGPPALLTPALIAILAALVLGVSFLAARFALFRRDVQILIPLALQFLMYCAPVFYGTELIPPQYRTLYLLNPLAALIDAFRRVLLYEAWPDWPSLAIATAVSFALLAAGYLDFKNSEGEFADRL
jgi:lipopolysaccharide transport system permease protein